MVSSCPGSTTLPLFRLTLAEDRVGISLLPSPIIPFAPLPPQHHLATPVNLLTCGSAEVQQSTRLSVQGVFVCCSILPPGRPHTVARRPLKPIASVDTVESDLPNRMPGSAERCGALSSCCFRKLTSAEPEVAPPPPRRFFCDRQVTLEPKVPPALLSARRSWPPESSCPRRDDPARVLKKSPSSEGQGQPLPVGRGSVHPPSVPALGSS